MRVAKNNIEHEKNYIDLLLGKVAIKITPLPLTLWRKCVSSFPKNE
jgi:hypothetical protein